MFTIWNKQAANVSPFTKVLEQIALDQVMQSAEYPMVGARGSCSGGMSGLGCGCADCGKSYGMSGLGDLPSGYLLADSVLEWKGWIDPATLSYSGDLRTILANGLQNTGLFNYVNVRKDSTGIFTGNYYTITVRSRIDRNDVFDVLYDIEEALKAFSQYDARGEKVIDDWSRDHFDVVSTPPAPPAPAPSPSASGTQTPGRSRPIARAGQTTAPPADTTQTTTSPVGNDSRCPGSATQKYRWKEGVGCVADNGFLQNLLADMGINASPTTALALGVGGGVLALILINRIAGR
jgi:hypothetical protein